MPKKKNKIKQKKKNEILRHDECKTMEFYSNFSALKSAQFEGKTCFFL